MVREFFTTVLPDKMPDYEMREAQVQMADLIYTVFKEGGQALLEAGTGTGKSLAYLVPSLLVKSSTPIAISTGTKNLQEQLVKKDLPFLHSVWGEDFSYMLIQGRSNYLCRTKLYNSLINEEERNFLKQWAEETDTGNLSELTGKIHPETLKTVAADPDYCLGQKCTMRDECFTALIRSRAEKCQLLVVNHHLLLSDLMIKDAIGFEQGAILPKLDYIVIDEAHHLEDVAAESFGKEVNFDGLFALRSQIYNSRELQRRNIEIKGKIESELVEATSHINRAKELIRKKEAEESERIEIDSEIALVAGNIRSCYKEVYRLLKEYDEDTVDAIAFARKAERIVSGLDAFISEKEDNISWANREGFHNMPLKVAEELNRVLFQPHKATVLTSATLSTSGNFRYIKSRLGLKEAKELTLPSPFDYKKVLLAIPDDLLEPNSQEFITKITEHLKKILPKIKGGSFVLCTSFKMVKALKEGLQGFANLYVHGDKNAPDLIADFKADGNGVLIGVDSFWEGVDVPGEALKAVFITKLPFPVPSEPLYEARRKLVEERGGNSFRELSLPIALLKLRQGFGRLVRRQNDDGLVVIYDSRVLVKNYRKDVFNSLPKCSEWRGHLDELETYIEENNFWREKLLK